MPGPDPFLTYAEDTSSKVDMAQNIERGVNDRSVFDQEYYTGKDKVTPPEEQPPAMPPAPAAPLPGSSEYRANPFTGQGPEISTITGHPIKKWGIAAQEPVPSHEVYKPPPEPWDQIALKTWKGIGLQAEKIAGSTVRLAHDIAPDATPQSRFAIDTEAQDLNRQIAENQPGEGSTWAQRQAFGLGSSLPVVVAAVGGGIVTKAPSFAGYLMGFTSGVEKYSDLKDYGYDTGKAAIVASLYGSADAIFFGKAAGEWQAMLTAGKAATPTLERTAVEHVSEWAGQAFRKYGVVIGAMELDTAAKAVVSKLSDQPNMTAHDFAESMFDTLVQGTAIHAGMTAAGAMAGLARKTDRGPADFKGWVAQEFPKMPFAETDYGGNVTLPDGRTLEIHTPFSPAAAKLMAEGLAGGDQQVASEIKAGEKVVSGMYFKVGDTKITENDLIFLTGQGTDTTTLGHEKGHLVMSAVNMLATPEELKAVGLDAKGTDQEKVIGGKFEEYIAQRTASPENPKSPLDKMFAKVVDFANEAYSRAAGTPTERAVFERIRSGAMLQRAGATPEQAAKMAERGQYQVRPDTARKIDIVTRVPEDPAFRDAIANTPGAEVTPDGILLTAVRFQKPEQGGEFSVRGGVFYLPQEKSPYLKYYRTSPGKEADASYGGTEKVVGQTLLRRPIVVKAASGGRGPELAYDTIKGKGAYEAMRKEVLSTSYSGWGKGSDPAAIQNLLDEYAPDLAENGVDAWYVLSHSKKGNTLAYALQEAAVASAVREAGYDSVLSYTKRRDGSHFLSEVYDVREVTYPTRDGESELHPKFKVPYQIKDEKVATKDGSFPLDHNGWKFEGEMYGYYQYTSKDPASPSHGTTILVDKPENLQAKIEASDKRFSEGGPKFQTRTPGPKGLTVNFTAPEVTALGEELLRGAFDKLQFTQSNDASLKKAQELIASKKMSLDTFLNHDPYTAWPDTAHQVAAEAIAGGVFDYVKGRIAEYDAGRITADEANKARMVGMASIASWYLPQSEVARMLQARQMAISPEGIPIRDLMAEQMKFETDIQELKNRGLVTDDQVLDAMSKFYSIDQAQNFVSRVAKAKVKEPSVLNQLFYFSLLSNPVTHAANVIGNVSPMFFAVADQYLAEKSPFGATPKGGAAGMAAGLVHSIFDAYALMKRSAYTGEAMFGPGKVEGGPARTGVESIDQARSALNEIHNDPTHPYHDPASSEFDAAKRDVMLLHRKAYNPISGDRLNRLTGGNMDASGFFPRMADFMGEAIDAPFKGLNAEDMFFKVLNQRMWIWKSAYEMAGQNGLEGDAFNKFVATFVEDPPPTTMATAEEFALKQTFNNEPGKIAESLMGITRQYPIARFILPFVRVPSNILRFALETTPFAPLLRQVRSDISNGGKARDMALSKMAIGTSMMAGVATLAAAGVITGGGPTDPKMKKIWTDSGWQEYSVKIGGTYYSYKRLDPFAMPIGVAADLVEMARFAPDFGFDEAALVGALSFIRNFTSKSYMQGFADFLTAITAGGEDTMLASATKYGKGLPRTLVPGISAQAARVTDPMKRNVDGWLDTLKSRIPGLSSTLEPNYNLKGDPITIGMYESMPGKGFGMVNPVLWSEDTKDPVWQEIRRNRVPVTMPSRTIGGQDPGRPQLDQGATGQKLTPEQYSWLVKMAGNGLKDPRNGRGAWDELTAIVSGTDPVTTFGGKPIYYAQKNDDGSPVFTDGPDGGKAMIIQKVIGKYREGAKRILEGGEPFPELHNEYVIGQTKKKMNQAPQVGGVR